MVKGFNTLSAWALQNGPSDANRQVINASACCVKVSLFAWYTREKVKSITYLHAEPHAFDSSLICSHSWG